MGLPLLFQIAPIVCSVHRVLFDFWYREIRIQLDTDKIFELFMLLLSYVLAATSVLTGYVCEVFVDSICNMFRFCDSLCGQSHISHI